MQQIVHCGFRVNELSRFEQCFFGGIGVPRGLSVYYILFSFVCSIIDFKSRLVVKYSLTAHYWTVNL